MPQNIFVWWPGVNENEPWFNENWDKKEEKLKNIDQWGWLYAPFESEEWVKPINKNKDKFDSNQFFDDTLGEDNWYIEPKEELKENNDTQKQIDENPNSPLIDWFIWKWMLSLIEWNSIKKALINEWDLKTNINKVEWLDSEKQKHVIDSIDFLNWPESKKQSLETFNKDFETEIDWLKVSIEWWNKWEKELVWQNKELIELLGWNYFNLTDNEGVKEINKDALNRWFKTTLNQLMEWKSFKRPDTFDNMLNIIKNPELSFKERFNELKKVDILINKDQSRANWKSAKAFSKMKKWSEKQNLNLEEKFTNLKEEIKIWKENNDKKILKELLIKSNDFEKEIEESWEVFEWTNDFEKLLKEIQEVLWEQT